MLVPVTWSRSSTVRTEIWCWVSTAMNSSGWGVWATTVVSLRAVIAARGWAEFADEVARHEDRAALLGECAEMIAQPADAIRVESVGRFVEQ